jgi:hypothetical protein
MVETGESVRSLYRDFFERGLRYFFPRAELSARGQTPEALPVLRIRSRTDGALDIEWMGATYHFAHPQARPFTEDQLRLVGSIGSVLSARYRSIFTGSPAAAGLFSGLPEDRYVSAFLDPSLYLSEHSVPEERDVVADAIEVLRESSLLTFENRRISTGVILLGAEHSARRTLSEPPEGAVPYTNSLVSIKSFHRLCDGLHTVFLVNRQGLLVDLVDIRDFASFAGGEALPAPSSHRYHAHCRATLHGGNICLVLTPNGEMKVIAGGAQVLNFLEGRWRLTDLTEKYRAFRRAIGDADLAERLFTAALNLAEHRRGGLFVVLERREAATDLVAPADLLDNDGATATRKGQIHYLLRNKKVLELDLSVLQSIARMDGGIVMDRSGSMLAFGAILRDSGECQTAHEGGRTTAAVHASTLGHAIKISEDGLVSFYQGGAKVWEI